MHEAVTCHMDVRGRMGLGKQLGNGCRRKEFKSPFQFLQKLKSPLQYRLTVLVFVAQASVDLGEVVHSCIFMQEKKPPRKTARIILLFPKRFFYKPSNSYIVGLQEVGTSKPQISECSYKIKMFV